MSNFKTLILPGKDLSENDLKVINDSRFKEFNSQSLIKPLRDNEDWNKIYFLLKESEQLLAFGRLHDVNVECQEKTYQILGIATIVSVIKGKGYGFELMQSMKKYILSTGKTGIGFCNKNITEFYRKCGLGILENGQDRFEYSEPARYQGGDVIFIKGADDLIDRMVSDKNITARISRPQW